MTFMYSASGKRIALQLSSDDIAVLFDEPKVAKSAVNTLRAAARKKSAEPPARKIVTATRPQHFGRIALMHESGSADAPIRAVAGALARAHAVRAQRSFPVYVDVETKLRAIATLEISVRFKRKVAGATQRKLLQSLNLKLVRTCEFSPRNHIVVQTNQPDEWKTLDLANQLSERAEVEYAAPNFISEHRKFYQPNDPLLSNQWHLANLGNNGALPGEDVDALLAWDVSHGGDPGIVIAIVDGVDAP